MADGWGRRIIGSRQVEKNGEWQKPQHEVVYLDSSLPAAASPQAMLGDNRDHWRIEIMHRNKDVILGEDGYTNRCDNAPRNIFSLTGFVLKILKSVAPSPTRAIEHLQRGQKNAQSGCCKVFTESPCFKYMREEFLLDALIDYQIEPEDPTRTIPKPERRALDKEIRAARADLARLEREYGAAAADNAERRRPTMRGFKIAHGRLGKQLRTARARVAQLFEQRRDVAKRVEVRDLNERAVVKLATERKHLTDIIKMVAYQAESDLLALLRPHYARADQEGRTLLHELFTTGGDIRVCDSELHITLAPLSSGAASYPASPLVSYQTYRHLSGWNLPPLVIRAFGAH